jgi:valyl-tRNA synthetase
MPAGTQIWIPVAQHVDLAAETARLRKEVARITKEIERFNRKLGDAAFLQKAPAEIVEEQRTRLAASVAERDVLAGSLERMEAIGGSR